MSRIKKIFENKEFMNASWLIGGRIAQMLLSLVVGILTARYLGPSNYGLINYGAAYVSFFFAICTLGINNIIVKELIDHPNEQNIVIGSVLFMRMIASVFSTVMIYAFVSIVDRNEPVTISVVVIYSLSLIFQIFDTFNYWFQAQYKSKITAIAAFLAYFLTSIYKIILLIAGASVRWFAFSMSIDYIVSGLFLFVAYRKCGGEIPKYSSNTALRILKESYHFILSGLMVAIYGQTDKLMLKQMLNETAVGYYSTAVALCNMWVFVLVAIIDSINPTILRLYKSDYNKYEKKNKQLYAIVFYVSVFVSSMFLMFGDFAIQLLYGIEYKPAAKLLKIITWYTAFSYLGVARDTWIICEGKQHYLKYMYLSAAILNVFINFILIPIFGATGAAIASLITQILTCIVLPLFIKGMRRNSVLILQAIMLKGVFK